MSHEPDLVTDPALEPVLRELMAREPIFHHPERGTTRRDFEAMVDPGFWEVGASGRRYGREYVLDVLEERARHPRPRPLPRDRDPPAPPRHVARPNAGSLRVLEKNGFVLVHEERLEARGESVGGLVLALGAPGSKVPDRLAEGPRVFLRHPLTGDFEEYLALVAASRGLRRPWVHPPTAEAAFRARVERSASKRHLSAFVCVRDTGARGSSISPRSCAGCSRVRTWASTATPRTPGRA
jgi:hypothetical protein